jgi:hypothetical protein
MQLAIFINARTLIIIANFSLFNRPGYIRIAGRCIKCPGPAGFY